MANYRTPGVYVEEISKLPASIAQVGTAIPAFVGYTEKALRGKEDLSYTPVKIQSLLEFEELFGGAPFPKSIDVELRDDNSVKNVEIAQKYYLYNSIQLFYANGGSDCYIVSVGSYDDDISYGNEAKGLKKGLTVLKKYDEPTLLVIPDAVALTDDVLGTLQAEMLTQCGDLGDRFAILDVKKEVLNSNHEITEGGVDNFRTNVGTENLKFGAAYYPYLNSSLSFKNKYDKLNITKGSDSVSLSDENDAITPNFLDFKGYNALLTNDKTKIEGLLGNSHGTNNDQTYEDWYVSIGGANKKTIQDKASVIKQMANDLIDLVYGTDKLESSDLLNFVKSRVDSGKKLNGIITTLAAYDYGYAKLTNQAVLGIIVAGTDFTDDNIDYSLVATNTISDIYLPGTSVGKYVENSAPYFRALFDQTLSIFHSILNELSVIEQQLDAELATKDAVYGAIVQAIKAVNVELPPSGAVAGRYAYVDNSRGVWKAPANVGINGVVGPNLKITNSIQDGLNIDSNSGKSINAIRAFTGKGTLIWGAKTLAGNDNEWKYIPVRRLFNMVEESIQKGTSWAVFESNDANTWVRMKAQVENYLFNLWKAGALAGAISDDAYFVEIGLGKTMTPQDILEGRLIMEIGMAAVRPAEFIIIKFMHKLQES